MGLDMSNFLLSAGALVELVAGDATLGTRWLTLLLVIRSSVSGLSLLGVVWSGPVG